MSLSAPGVMATDASSPNSTQIAEKSEMLYRRGLAAYQAGDYLAAETYFEETLAINFSPNAAVYLTYLRKERGDFTGALKSLQTYLDNTNDSDSDLQSYISLKLFLEARLASEANEKQLSSNRATTLISIVIAIIALIVSVASLLYNRS
ncbi:MAG: hypothetical protein F7O42_10380 [Opitutae bacterium]|nr:hypothetical protein [Opitutae bacterium]